VIQETRRATGDWAASYFAEIETQGEGSEYEQLYLWPRTPIGPTDLQDVITRRIGASDFDVGDPRSRSALIIAKLRQLLADPASGLTDGFRLLDLACGDAVVLWEIKKAFPRAECHGLDCNKGLFATHAPAMELGVQLHRGYLQHLFVQSPQNGHRFDVTVMLNTYRGWESADLSESEQDLPEQADAWFARNSRFVIVTATGDQIAQLRRQGWFVEELGKGEDESTMICMTRDDRGQLGGRLRRAFRR
jgi:hypothetical protein